MKRLNVFAALAAAAVLVSAGAVADDRGHRGWDRDHYSHDYRQHGRSERHDRRWDNRRWEDGRWDNRRYVHNRSVRYWAPPGQRYWNGYSDGYRGNRYNGNYYGSSYGGRYYYSPHHRYSGIDATIILTFPIW